MENLFSLYILNKIFPHQRLNFLISHHVNLIHLNRFFLLFNYFRIENHFQIINFKVKIKLIAFKNRIRDFREKNKLFLVYEILTLSEFHFHIV